MSQVVRTAPVLAPVLISKPVLMAKPPITVVPVSKEERMRETIDVLCEGLRPEARQFMGDVTRAAIDDAEGLMVVPLARRILNDYDVDLTVEVFILSLQAHKNTFYDLAKDVIEPHSKDVEADTLAWLAVHYIVSNPVHLKRA